MNMARYPSAAPSIAVDGFRGANYAVIFRTAVRLCPGKRAIDKGHMP